MTLVSKGTLNEHSASKYEVYSVALQAWRGEC